MINEKHAKTKHHLAPNSKRFQNPKFKAAILKIQNAEKLQLTVNEKKMMSQLKLHGTRATTKPSLIRASLSFAGEVLRKAEVDGGQGKDKLFYMDLSFILPT